MRCREVKIAKGPCPSGVFSPNKGPYPTGVSENIVAWDAPSDFPIHVIPVEFEGPLKRIAYGTRPSTWPGGRHAYRLFFENDRVVEIIVGRGGRGRRRRMMRPLMLALVTPLLLAQATPAPASLVWGLWCGDPPTERKGVFDTSRECWDMAQANAPSSVPQVCRDTKDGPRYYDGTTSRRPRRERRPTHGLKVYVAPWPSLAPRSSTSAPPSPSGR